MTYSSAIFEPPTLSLEEAQDAKLARIGSWLDIGAAGTRILEIGCGWGALASKLAHMGAHVTGLTLSKEQLAFAQERIAREGMAERVDLRLQDYRDVEGQFDRIVSIEMLEAVGEQYWRSISAHQEASRAGGCRGPARHHHRRAALRGLSRQSGLHPALHLSRRHAATKEIMAAQAKAAGLVLEKVESFGLSYAMTLAELAPPLPAALAGIEKMGFDTTFKRLWEYYLAYCEGGFRAL